jgi:hypothetical protein
MHLNQKRSVSERRENGSTTALEHVLARTETLVAIETANPASVSVKNTVLSAPIRVHPANVG